jgi:hypothetical protein
MEVFNGWQFGLYCQVGVPTLYTAYCSVSAIANSGYIREQTG